MPAITTKAWRRIKLSESGRLVMGQSPPGSSYNEVGKGLPLLNGANEVTQTGIKISKFTSQPTRSASAGDYLFCIRATIGNLNVAEQEYCLGRGVAALKVNKEYSKKFIYYHLENLFVQMKQMSQGGVIKGLKKDEIADFTILVPPNLKTQEEIASVLGNVDQLVDISIDEIGKLNDLKLGLMHHLFANGISHTKFKDSELGQIPEVWEVQELSEIAQVERGKFSHRPRNDPAFYGGDIPFIQTGNVVNSNGRINSYSQTLNKKGLSVSRSFPIGTVVMTIAANIGATAILDIEACFPDSLVGITPTEGIDSEYLEYFLQTRVKHLNSIATQSAQKNINLEKLNPLKILVPPLDEQREIAGILKLVDEKLILNQQLKVKQEELKRGLMQDLLSEKVAV